MQHTLQHVQQIPQHTLQRTLLDSTSSTATTRSSLPTLSPWDTRCIFRKRALHIPQKSPSYSAKEPFIFGLFIFRTRAFHIPQTRRVFPAKEPYNFRETPIPRFHKPTSSYTSGYQIHIPPAKSRVYSSNEPNISRQRALYSP